MSKNHKIGAGLRHQHFPYLIEKPQISASWFEVISENFMNTSGYPMEVLLSIREDYPISLHGVSLNIAGSDDIDRDYLKKLKSLIGTIEPFNVSDHLCWTGMKKNNLHNLLPFPYSDEALEHIVGRVQYVQEFIGRPLILENLSAYLGVKDCKYTEAEFINEIAKRSGAKILLDINNIYVNAKNQKFNPHHYFDTIDPSYIAEIHLAGFTDMGEYLFDTHSCPVFPEVWKLYEYFLTKKNDIPTLIEWDEDIPEFEVLDQEVKKAISLWENSFD
ncbi:DUF692 domain-containing protein [Halobacteriovorax sp. JY17]|uniref:MNIO family bufferin maturase n=1 Tax=Halobacteriovorax sp. JY17 TaxID=2014617 RepID=UPI000C5082C9|nr:DUF692 domain-containing protein [Halobacteriovorax sp. JY17]PIK13589.1 MAG: hypothetical protein CES88_15475 [Halobacteriovorax sp. JY17]